MKNIIILDASTDMVLIAFCLGLIIVLFIVLRQVNLWYFRINERVKNQQEIIRLLSRIAGEDKLKGILPGNNEAYNSLSKEDKEVVLARAKAEGKA